MPKWLRTTENDAGEWSVTDLKRDYRLCNFNHQAHGPPHLHAPIDAKASMQLPLATVQEAEAFMRHYAVHHVAFSPKAFKEEVQEWKSGSKSA